MVKLLLLAGIVLITAVVAQRKGLWDYENSEFGNGFEVRVRDFRHRQQGRNQNYGKRRHGFPGSRNNFRGHGCKSHFPPFLVNVTRESREEFFAIMKEWNLTKAEIETKIDEWAQRLGQEVQDGVSEFRKLQKEVKDLEEQKVKEILTSVSNLFEKALSIQANMNISRYQEKQEMAKLFANESQSHVKIMKMVAHQAHQEAKFSKRVTVAPTNPENTTIPN